MANLPQSSQSDSMDSLTVTREQFRLEKKDELEYLAQALGNVSGSYTTETINPTAVTLQGTPTLATAAEPAAADSSLRLVNTRWVKQNAASPGTTPPTAPVRGQIWIDTSQDPPVMNVWDDTPPPGAWVPASGGASVEIGATPPATPTAGDMWWNSDDGRLYIYYTDADSSQWVDASPDSVAPPEFWSRTGTTISPKTAGDDVQLNSLNGGPLAGFRNVLINGDLRIWQRSLDKTATGYAGPDRWHQWTTLATAGAAAPRVARDVGIPGLFSYSARVVNTSTADDSRLEQGVELERAGEAAPFQIGSTWTLSYYATAPQTVFGIAFFDNVYPASNPSGNQPDPGEKEIEDLGGGWKRYSRTIVIAGGPVGSNLCLRVLLGASNPCDYKISGIQLEPGPVATPFEHRPIGTELALCQRYYFKSQSSGTAYAYLSNFGSTLDSTTARFSTALPVEMRSSPTVGYSDVGIDKHTVTYSITGLTIFGGLSKTIVGLSATGASGMTANQPVVLFGNAVNAGYIDYSAEL